MKALSIRQPWTTMLVHGQKRVENRSRRTNHRGQIALHASGESRWDFAGQFSHMVDWQWRMLRWPGHPDAESEHIIFGAVLGVADIVDVCNGTVDSLTLKAPCECDEWAVPGQYHWRLANVRPLAEPVPCRGALGLWTLPDDVETAVVAQLGEQVSTRG